MKWNRLAVTTYFFVNGFLYANWAARLPEMQQFYNISNTRLGSLLLTMAAGAILAMPFTGWLTTRFSTRTVTILAGLGFCISVPFLVISPSFWIYTSVFFMMGLFSGAMDVAMNGQAVFVERLYAKPIMSSFHAMFSIGMALGAGAGALFAKFTLPLWDHLLLVSLIGLGSHLLAFRYLIRDQPEQSTGRGGHFQLPTKAILPLGIMAFCGMTGEGAMADWSAIFMNTVVGQNEAFSALTFGTFAAAMTIGRLFGDHFTGRYGARQVLIFDSSLALVGLGLLLAFPLIWTTFLGFFLTGLGLSTVVPIVYSKAGNTPGVGPSAGIAMATTIGYTGFFVGPPVIGFLSDLYGLRFALTMVLLLFAIMWWLVRRI